MKYDGDMEFICPRPEWGQEQKYVKQYFDWKQACKEAEFSYKSLIDLGEPPQIARSVLPNCLKTEIVMTANFRAWRHFLKLRMAKGAHPQIREVAGMVCNWLNSYCPVIVEDLV